MTETDFLALDPTQLEAGPLADRAMAFALGWSLDEGFRWIGPDGKARSVGHKDEQSAISCVQECLPHYSTDPHAAVDVVIAERLALDPEGEHWYGYSPFVVGERQIQSEADTYPLAVTRCMIAMEQARRRAL